MSLYCAHVHIHVIKLNYEQKQVHVLNCSEYRVIYTFSESVVNTF